MIVGPCFQHSADLCISYFSYALSENIHLLQCSPSHGYCFHINFLLAQPTADTRSCSFQGPVPDCRDIALHHFSLPFPDCPCVLVTPLAFKVKAADYLQLHKYLIVERITWGMAVKHDFFHLNLSGRSTEIQHYWSTEQTGPTLHQGCHVHSYSYQHLDRMEQGPSLHFLCGNYCLKEESVPRGASAALSDSWQETQTWKIEFCCSAITGTSANEGVKNTNIQEAEAT